jgi:hypothetical protein
MNVGSLVIAFTLKSKQQSEVSEVRPGGISVIALQFNHSD